MKDDPKQAYLRDVEVSSIIIGGETDNRNGKNESFIKTEVSSTAHNSFENPSINARDIVPSEKVKLEHKERPIASHLIRLFLKDGEYVYARADDIIMIESSNHLIYVYVAREVSKIRKTIRNSSLKDFLMELPENNFIRISRFCAVNSKRLSGGNYHQQIFEFDYCITIKPKHSVSHTVFNAIGK